MLTSFDVPFYGPQWLAWRVDGRRLHALREALRVVVERADVAPIQRFWSEQVVVYRERYLASRWRVPTETVERVLSVLEGVANEDRVDGQAVAECASAVRELLAGRTHIDVTPDHWLGVLPDAVRRLEQGLLVPVYAEMLVSRLRALTAVPTACYLATHDDLERLPSGSLDWVPRAHFFVGEREVAADDIDEPCETRIDAGVALPSDCLRYHFDITIRAATCAGAAIEMVIPPFARPRGPGPFVTAIEGAQPLAGRDWNRLPIFRVPDIDRCWLELDAYELSGDRLEQAADHMRRVLPPFRYWLDEDERDFYADFNDGHTHPGWLPFERCEVHWPRCRARFLELLAEAASARDAVLMLRQLPDDQGPIAGPLTDEWGHEA